MEGYGGLSEGIEGYGGWEESRTKAMVIEGKAGKERTRHRKDQTPQNHKKDTPKATALEHARDGNEKVWTEQFDSKGSSTK